ncbi:hypothetical protein TNCV_4108111 [Trichonephila clavipes]|nr:hypothetical protein TNCV_4108111 [Trichonephila clavipes]
MDRKITNREAPAQSGRDGVTPSQVVQRGKRDGGFKERKRQEGERYYRGNKSARIHPFWPNLRCDAEADCVTSTPDLFEGVRQSFIFRCHAVL